MPYNWILGRHFLNLVSLLLDNSRFCALQSAWLLNVFDLAEIKDPEKGSTARSLQPTARSMPSQQTDLELCLKAPLSVASEQVTCLCYGLMLVIVVNPLHKTIASRAWEQSLKINLNTLKHLWILSIGEISLDQATSLCRKMLEFPQDLTSQLWCRRVWQFPCRWSLINKP